MNIYETIPSDFFPLKYNSFIFVHVNNLLYNIKEIIICLIVDFIWVILE